MLARKFVKDLQSFCSLQHGIVCDSKNEVVIKLVLSVRDMQLAHVRREFIVPEVAFIVLSYARAFWSRTCRTSSLKTLAAIN